MLWQSPFLLADPPKDPPVPRPSRRPSLTHILHRKTIPPHKPASQRPSHPKPSSQRPSLPTHPPPKSRPSPQSLSADPPPRDHASPRASQRPSLPSAISQIHPFLQTSPKPIDVAAPAQDAGLGLGGRARTADDDRLRPGPDPGKGCCPSYQVQSRCSVRPGGAWECHQPLSTWNSSISPAFLSACSFPHNQLGFSGFNLIKALGRSTSPRPQSWLLAKDGREKCSLLSMTALQLPPQALSSLFSDIHVTC